MTVSTDSTSLEIELDTGASHCISKDTKILTHTELPLLKSKTAQYRTYTGLVSHVHPFQLISVSPNQ